MVFDILNAIIAGLAFILSIVSLVWQWSSSRFHLSVDFDNDECFYFEPLSTIQGNRESLIANVCISNRSSQPIHIASAQIVLDNGCAVPCCSAQECMYPSHLPDETFATLKGDDGLLYIKFHTGDGYTVKSPTESMIRFPMYLQPYECVSGYLLFPLAGESTPETKIRLVTSRKKHTVVHSFKSKGEYESSF